MSIYFDNAATTPIDPAVLEAMMPYLSEHFGNPSSIHACGRRTKAAIEKARKTVASILNVSPSEIFFTSGGTESNNCVLFNAVKNLGVKRIISSEIEHHCITHTLDSISDEYGVEIVYVNLLKDGQIDINHLTELLNDKSKTTLVSLMHANNEVGNLTDIKTIGDLCEETNTWFHSDTVQTVAHYPLNLQEIKAHFISGAAHKFHGPKGVGFLYIKGGVESKPLLFGGAQERNMRAGTENLYGIIGLAKALEIAVDEMEKDRIHIQSLKNYFKKQLDNHFDKVKYNGDTEGPSLYTVLNVSFEAYDKSALLLLNLDINNICASGGSACSSGSDTGSHVLKTIYGNQNRSNSVRFSFSKFNTQHEIDNCINVLKKLLLPEYVMSE